MSNQFEVTWEADDGYCGGSRPHSFHIRAEDIEEDMTEKELSDLFWDEVQNDFQQRVSPVSRDEDEFIAWAKEQIENRIGGDTGE